MEKLSDKKIKKIITKMFSKKNLRITFSEKKNFIKEKKIRRFKIMIIFFKKKNKNLQNAIPK